MVSTELKLFERTYSSSIACCVGSGSSSPKPIISQEAAGSNPEANSGTVLAAGEILSLF